MTNQQSLERFFWLLYGSDFSCLGARIHRSMGHINEPSLQFTVGFKRPVNRKARASCRRIRLLKFFYCSGSIAESPQLVRHPAELSCRRANRISMWHSDSRQRNAWLWDRCTDLLPRTTQHSCMVLLERELRQIFVSRVADRPSDFQR